MRKFVFLLAGLFAATVVFSQTTEQKMDELITAYLNSGKFNGSVLVAHKGKILLNKGYGLSSVEPRVTNDSEGVYQIGSLTKQFTSALIMQLVEEKKLSLQDPLNKYFSGFANGDKITIEHLLTHQSGIYNYTRDTIIMKNDVTRHYSADYMIGIFSKYSPDFEPGTKFSYSNSGYSMLGYIAEKVTGKPYEKLIRERIFKPLAMTRSGFDFTHLKDPKKTKGYFVVTSDTVMAAPIVDSTIAYSAGAIYSTTADLYKWERAVSAGKLLSPASWKAVFTPQKSKYGYGWGIDSAFGYLATTHSGGIHGYASYIFRVPSEDLVVIAMDNYSGRSTGLLSRDLVAIALGKPYKIPGVNNEIKLDTSILRQYVGEYQLAPEFSITIFLDGTKLKAQATNQAAFEVFAEKENLFFYKVVEAKLEFIKNEKGEVTELVLYQGGQAPRGKKIK